MSKRITSVANAADNSRDQLLTVAKTLREALAVLDDAVAPADIGAHIEQALHRIERIMEVKR